MRFGRNFRTVNDNMHKIMQLGLGNYMVNSSMQKVLSTVANQQCSANMFELWKMNVVHV